MQEILILIMRKSVMKKLSAVMMMSMEMCMCRMCMFRRAEKVISFPKTV